MPVQSPHLPLPPKPLLIPPEPRPSPLALPPRGADQVRFQRSLCPLQRDFFFSPLNGLYTSASVASPMAAVN